MHSSLNHIFGMTKGNVLVPALHIVCRNTYRTALLADVHAASGRIKKFKGIGDDDCNENRRHNNDRANLSGAVTLLQESFSKSLNDRKEFVVRFSVYMCFKNVYVAPFPHPSLLPDVFACFWFLLLYLYLSYSLSFLTFHRKIK